MLLAVGPQRLLQVATPWQRSMKSGAMMARPAAPIQANALHAMAAEPCAKRIGVLLALALPAAALATLIKQLLQPLNPFSPTWDPNSPPRSPRQATLFLPLIPSNPSKLAAASLHVHGASPPGAVLLCVYGSYSRFSPVAQVVSAADNVASQVQPVITNRKSLSYDALTNATTTALITNQPFRAVVNDLVQLFGGLVGAKEIDLEPTITTFADDLTKLDGVKDGIRIGFQILHGVVEFLQTEAHTLLAALSEQSLDKAFRSGGVRGMLETAAHAVDSGIRFFNSVQNITHLNFNLTAKVEGAATFIEKFDSDEAANEGFFYWAAHAAQWDRLVPADYARSRGGGYLTKDVNYQPWPDNKLCLNRDCLKNMVKEVSTVALADAKGLPGGRPPSIPFSRETLLFFPFLIPLILSILALITTLPCGCTCRRGSCCECCAKETAGVEMANGGYVGAPRPCVWQLHMAWCVCAVIVIYLPIALIIGGIALFPPTMVLHDTCASAANIAYRFADGSKYWVCNTMGGTVMPGGDCRMDFVNETITFSVPVMVDDLLGSCSEVTGYGLPGVYHQVNTVIKQAMKTEVWPLDSCVR